MESAQCRRLRIARKLAERDGADYDDQDALDADMLRCLERTKGTEA